MAKGILAASEPCDRKHNLIAIRPTDDYLIRLQHNTLFLRRIRVCLLALVAGALVDQGAVPEDLAVSPDG